MEWRTGARLIPYWLAPARPGNPMSDTENEFAGPYKPIRRLASGGQASIFLAEGPEGHVALKVVRTKGGLTREVEALQRCTHPSVPRLVARSPDDLWLALEVIDGDNFDRWMEAHSISERIKALIPVFEAIVALHAVGVVHGDLKPGNVLVDREGRAFLVDLGSATIDGEGPAGFRGSPGFAAPEVVRGESPSPASDAYGIGALLYVALTGQPPFVSSDPASLAYISQVSLPEPPSAGPEGLLTLIGALLSRSPAQRPEITSTFIQRIASLADAPQTIGVVGMRFERDRLRRAVVGATDGECRVVVVHGPSGTGRSAVIREALAIAAQEGLTVGPLSARPGLACSVDSPDATAAEIVRKRLEQATPGVVFIRSAAPLPSLVRRAEVLTLPPLSEEETLQWYGLAGIDEAEAQQLWTKFGGHPAHIADRLGVRAPDPLEARVPTSATDPETLAESLGIRTCGSCDG